MVCISKPNIHCKCIGKVAKQFLWLLISIDNCNATLFYSMHLVAASTLCSTTKPNLNTKNCFFIVAVVV